MDTYLNQSYNDDFRTAPVCKSDSTPELGIYNYFNQGFLSDYTYVKKVAVDEPVDELGIFGYFNQGFLNDYSYVPIVDHELPKQDSLRVSLITLTPLYLAPML